MNRLFILAAIILLACSTMVFTGCPAGSETPAAPMSNPTPTFTSTSTPTPCTCTPTFTSTFTPTFTPSFTPTETFTPTITFTPSFTRTFTATFTPSFTRTFTPTFTPSFTRTMTFTPTITFTPTMTATAPATVNISVTGFTYPVAVTVAQGGSVIWNNTSGFSHTIHAFDGGSCTTTTTYNNGNSVTLTFPTLGTFRYHCQIHSVCGLSCATPTCPQMSGSVVVQ